MWFEWSKIVAVLGVCNAKYSTWTFSKFQFKPYIDRNDFNNHQIFDLDNASDILTHPQYNGARKTTLYVHGYIERPEVESIHVIVDAYLKRENENIILLDWGTLADGNYLLDAVQNAKQLGVKMADVLIEMFTDGLNVQLFHLVGHSLGGQLSGIIGRNVIKKTNKSIILPRFVLDEFNYENLVCNCYNSTFLTEYLHWIQLFHHSIQAHFISVAKTLRL